MFLTIFTWWVWLELLGLIALPFAFTLFKNLPDRGYPLSKVLSILLLSYLMWLGASLHVIANRRWSIVLVVLVFAVFSVLIARRQWSTMKAFFVRNRGLIIATEVVFLGGIVLLTVLRAYNPFIHLPEHPINYAYMSSIMRSDYMPPPDPWLSGFTLNYYYFGHFVIATLTKLTGLPLNISYNLSMGLLFSLSALGILSLIYNLTRGDTRKPATSGKAIFMGVAAIVLLLLIGNLEGALEFLYAHNFGSTEFWKWIGIKELTTPYNSPTWYPVEPPHWWQRSVRVIDTLTPEGASLDLTFNDYPFFNLLAGYIHAHFITMPLDLLALSFALALFNGDKPLTGNWLRENWLFFTVAIVSFGALGPAGSWDLATFGILFVVVILISGYVNRQRGSRSWWLDTLMIGAMAFIGMFLLYLPYYNSFQPYSGFAPWLGPNARNVHLFLFFGVLAFTVMVSLVVFAIPALRQVSIRIMALAVLPLIIPISVWVFTSRKIGVTPITPSIGVKLGNMAPLLVLLILVLLFLLVRIKLGRELLALNKSAVFAILCMLAALYLIFGIELFYFKEVLFAGRTNTVFKFYYHVWILLALGGSYCLYYLLFVWKPSSIWLKIGRSFWWIVFGLLLGGSLLYSTGATLARTNFFKGEPVLDGLSFLSPDDRGFIDWLNDNVKGSPVIVEASNIWSVEESRVSVRTGLPTILGPFNIERGQRGADEREFRSRIKDLETIYQDDDLFKVQSLLTKYQAQYIVVGWLENQRYGAGIKERFDGWFEKAFSNASTTVYKASPTLWRPAKSPKGQILEIFYRDPADGGYYPLPNNGQLSENTYHFNARLKNTGNEKVTVYLEVAQSDGIKLSSWGAPDWELSPGQEVALFAQGSNLRPAGKNVQMTFSLKEKGSNRILDTRVLAVRSK